MKMLRFITVWQTGLPWGGRREFIDEAEQQQHLLFIKGAAGKLGFTELRMTAEMVDSHVPCKFCDAPVPRPFLGYADGDRINCSSRDCLRKEASLDVHSTPYHRNQERHS